ncbi:MAG TPA: NAD(P)-binding protein, partial [Ilumatobacteraceae bacterium]|nr:NAD(P)-binding protein [Ilumatobacteraceae bacterium]
MSETSMNSEQTHDLGHVFTPLRVGTLALDHRLVVAPHGGGGGNLVGTENEFEVHAALWLAKVKGGFQWLGGAPGYVANPLPLGFEPSGVGAHGPGHFRHPLYRQRIGELARRVHDQAGYLSVQMVQQGGKPIGPSATFSSYDDHRIAHALNVDEIAWLVAEYGESAAIALNEGIDAVEIHANHDDVVQWFLSPLTNLRTDSYGGSTLNRMRYLREIVASIRDRAPGPFTFGLRLCMDELIDGGYALDECLRFVEQFSADGLVDYFSFDVGNNFGSPSYVQVGWHDDAEWADLCGTLKSATTLPVVYAGRVTSAEQAEQIIATGQADLVSMVRATFADPQLVNKARGIDVEPLRPCIGLNECINRKQVEGLTYACGVAPTWAREWELRDMPARTSKPRAVLVIGGGPGGMELAALCAEQGHQVRLWEKAERLGGLLNTAARLRANHKYARWIDWQVERLERVGVDIRVDTEATVESVLAAQADVIGVVTGSLPRLPPIAGINGPRVATMGAVINGLARAGHRVALIVEDDGPAPPSFADHLAGLGHDVTFIAQSNQVAPLVGKYSIGSMLARLVDG